MNLRGHIQIMADTQLIFVEKQDGPTGCVVEEGASEETKLSPEWEMAPRNEPGYAGVSETAFGQRQLEVYWCRD